MKKIAYFLLSLVFITNYSYSQGEVEALKYSRNELYGTARSMAMGNAFGALGGDITGVSINPAGIAVYRSSEVVGTIGFQRNTTEVGNINKGVNDFNLHNLGFVGYFPLRNEVMPMINFGFTYGRQKTFNNDMGAKGDAKSTMIDYIADKSFGINPALLEMGDNKPDPFFDQPWLPALAFNSWLIDDYKDSDGNFRYRPLINNEKPLQEIVLKERGYIDNYDFTIGTSLNNVLNIGFALTISNVYRSLYTDFYEDYDKGNYVLSNIITSRAAGVGAKLGVIYRPVNSIRLGFVYHTPTWYSFTDEYNAILEDDVDAYVTDPKYKKGRVNSGKWINPHNLRTPGKWILSGAAVLGNKFILSADYEVMNYRDMKLSAAQGYIESPYMTASNKFINEDFKLASTVRVGAEYRFTQQFSGRLGYVWMQNPYDDGFRKRGNAAVAGANTIYRMEGDTHYLTGGLGYRFNRNVYADLAVVYQTQQDDLYPFPNLYTETGELITEASPFTLKNRSVRGLLTLGYRF